MSCIVPFQHWTLNTSTTSHLPLQFYSHILLHNRASWLRIHIYTGTIHVGVAVFQINISNISANHRGEQSKNRVTLNYTIKARHSEQIQCSSCLNHFKEGTVYCLCGISPLPSLERTDKIRHRIGIKSNPLCILKRGHSGERNGPAQWQHFHWKATDATNGVSERRCNSISHRWLNDRRNGHTDGLLSIASTSIAPILAIWTTLRLGKDESHTRTCSYCVVKVERPREIGQQVEGISTYCELNGFDSDH